MAFCVEFRAEGTPAPKGRPRFKTAGGYVKAYTPAKTKIWELVVADAAKQAMGASKPVEWPVAVSIRVTLPITASWSKIKQQRAVDGVIHPIYLQDLDNHAKSVLDACNGILYIDDGQVIDLHISKKYGRYPGVEVTMIEVVE